MVSAMTILLNYMFNNELKLLFGEHYVIDVKNLKYSTNNKKYVIDCTIYTDDLELCEESYPEGLYLIINDAWKFMGMRDPLIITTSIDLFP
jgi:hypothetical protein